MKMRKSGQKSCSVKPWLRMHRETWTRPCLPWKKPWRYVCPADCSHGITCMRLLCSLYCLVWWVICYEYHSACVLCLICIGFSHDWAFWQPHIDVFAHRLWSLWIRRTWQRSNHTAVLLHWWRQWCMLLWPFWRKSQPGQKPRDSWVSDSSSAEINWRESLAKEQK